MKILWIVNTIFPFPAEKLGINKTVYGGWLNGMANNLKEKRDIDLAIATTYHGKELKEFNDGKIMYYLIPSGKSVKYDTKMEKNWEIINKKFKPDLVHIHGTEYAHGLSFINTCPEVKKVTSIQGLLYRYSDVYLGNINTNNIIRNITFRDLIKRDNLFTQKKKFEQRSKNEIETIKKSHIFIGRTTWDYANTKSINNNIKYYNGNETLRKGFYNFDWNINNIDRHTLFCSQAMYPIKGLHYLIETLYILKNKYNDVKLYVAGANILDQSTFKSKIKRTGYAKYLSKLIKKYQLEDNISFTGPLQENKMIEKLLKIHVFVLPSAIENSSNSLGEAMLLRNAMRSIQYWRNNGYIRT